MVRGVPSPTGVGHGKGLCPSKETFRGITPRNSAAFFILQTFM